MRDDSFVGERLQRSHDLRDIGVALHDLCQPLTTLQCRLEMAELIGTPDAYREAVETGLTECARLTRSVVPAPRDRSPCRAVPRVRPAPVGSLA